MELKVLNAKGQDAGAYEAAESLFGREYNEALIHQVVVAYLANARSGNRAQKGRSDIAKSTRKPWRQKGTGRARAGMASSPIWRGGGKIFPSSPEENFSHKVNRKMYRSAMASIYSKLAADGRLQVLDGLALSSPKTKEFVAALNSFNIDGSVLVIASEFDENLYLASRNVPHVLVLEANQVDPYSLVKFSHVLVMRDAVKKIEELYL